MLRSCIINIKINWDKHFPLVEFAYNNSFHSTISTALYKALYGEHMDRLRLVLEVLKEHQLYSSIVNVSFG